MRKSISFLILLLSSVTAFGQGGYSNVTASAGISHRGFCQSEMTGGVVWFDYDADGDDDLYTTGGLFDNVLYRNNGDGTFADATVAAGLTLPAGTHTQGVAAGDIDNDGYRELFVTTWFTQRNFFFKNNGDGTFSDISQASGLCIDTLWTSAVSFEDFNMDGLLDIYTANYVYLPNAILDTNNVAIGYAHRCDANSLFINNGDQTFTDVAGQFSVADTGCGLALILSDFDNDNDRDILIANDFGDWITPNVMFRNEWPAPFADISASSGMDLPMYGMGIASADYDHDLDFDYYVTDIGPSSLFNNAGNGTFADVAAVNGVANDSLNGYARTAWGAAFLDYDNDTWQDLFVSNGYIQLLPSLFNARQDNDAMYRHDGASGGFTDVSLALGFADTNASRGMAYSDYDLDGDIDLFVNVIRIDTNLNENSVLYRNDVQSGNEWIQFKLRGTRNNRDAFGSKVKIKTSQGWYVQELVSGSSHMSQNSSIVHFGLGTATQVDSVVVTWPDGNLQGFGIHASGSQHPLVEDSTSYLGAVKNQAWSPYLTVFPNPSRADVSLEITLLQSQNIRMRVVDLAGKTVFEGPQEQMGMGRHRLYWDGHDQSGQRLPEGLYLIQIEGTKGNTSARVMLLD